jgi:tetratricopeptide (TPR) repeat protein
MSVAEPILFDPAVEELLREIAADPDSCLLRVPRPAVVQSLAHRQEIVRPTATGLTSAERELLRVHRAEVAKLLREACVLRLASHPCARFELTLFLTGRIRTHVAREGDWRASARFYRTHSGGDVGVELLDACIEPEGLAAVSVSQLAAASMRLCPSDAARIYPSIELILQGNETAALHLLMEAVLQGLSARYAAHAWAQIGLAFSNLSEHRRSIEAYGTALKFDSELASALLSYFGCTCMAGSVHEIINAASRLEAAIAPDQDALRDYVSAIRLRPARLRPQPVHAQLVQLTKLQARVGLSARMVIDALR